MLYMLLCTNSPLGFNDQLSNCANDKCANGLIQIIFM